MAEDRKFKFEDGRFVNRVSGEAIPDDEPVILFRARDNRALKMLHRYRDDCTDEHHKRAVQDRIDEFLAYRAAHPERLKEPGITRHIRLNSDAELCGDCPPVGYPTDVTRCSPCPKRSEEITSNAIQGQASGSEIGAEEITLAGRLLEQARQKDDQAPSAPNAEQANALRCDAADLRQAASLLAQGLEVERLRAVVDAARRMPRETPAPGGCGTVHTFEIEAGTVWTLDAALTLYDRAALGGGQKDG